MDEDMELEEGEAYFYDNGNNNNNNNNNGEDKYDDVSVDPDVAFSYMDMKIQDVLGHFQKDFEGGVSAENLGSKYGGYGSFLPSYQRSRPSPSPSPIEGPHCKSMVSVAANEPQRQGYTQTITTVSHGKQRPAKSSEPEKRMPPLRTVEDENSLESADRKSSSSFPDQKLLKVRIKLGSSDNLSTQKQASTQNRAALYTGLGLDASPSTSMDESPCESEGMSCPLDMDFESPTSILQIMTSSSLDGDKLLSPLSNDLIQLVEKKRIRADYKGKKLPDEKVPGPSKKKNVAKDLKGSSSKNSKRKNLDADSLAYEDLMAKTLQLPIISGAEEHETSVMVQRFSDKEREDLNHSAWRVADDKKEAHEPETCFLAPQEKSVSSTERASSRGKKRPKGSRSEGIQLVGPAKESFNGASSMTMSKKSIKEDISRSGSESGELKSRKSAGKGRELYKEFFGEIEQEEKQKEMMRMDSRKAPDSAHVKLKERTDDKVAARTSMPMHADAASNVAPPGPESFVIKENWVCCDKCQKWRLLPVGKDPDSLPKKWLCSMLDWLPGKNRCSVSEIETNAVVSQSYALAPNTQSNVPLIAETPGFPTPAAPGNIDAVTVPEHSGKSRDKQKTIEQHSDEGGADTLRFPKKVRDIQSGDEDRRSSGGNTSGKLGRNGGSNDQARIWKPNSADEFLKQRRESLEKVNSDSEKSVLKKRSSVDSEDLGKDVEKHIRKKKARLSQIEGKDSNEKYASDGILNSSRKGERDAPPSPGPTSGSYKAKKGKGGFREVKSSPAESASSSPMRSSKAGVLSSAVKNVSGNEDKERSRSSKYEDGADKRKGSDVEVKARNTERKRSEDEQKYAVEKEAVGRSHGSEEKSFRRGSGSRPDQIRDETHIRKSKGLPPSGANHTETAPASTKLPSGPPKASKVSKPSDSSGSLNGIKQPGERKESFAQAAANAIKEAKDLKHMADRVKASGSNLEGTGLYFQAALKFLHGASLLESSFNASSKYAEMVQSEQTYSSTGKLFEFCAHEFEKSKEIASAALAYKSMEVAYMKVVYLSQNTASKDRHELQTALKLIPSGESPSSSASDVDHVNNTAAVDNKAPKEENMTRVAGSHIITSQNRPNFERLLNFSQNAISAMEASRRSIATFNTASSELTDARNKEVIPCIKRAIDFNFHDIEQFLQLVRIATEAISR